MSTPSTTPQTSSLPPKPGGGGKLGLGTILGAVALVVAVAALVVGAMYPTPASTTTAPPPTVVSAVVSSAGNLARGNEANTSTQVSTGVYHVFFDQYVWGCTWTAAIGTTDAGQESAGHASVTSLPVATYGITVRTFNASSSTPQNLSFHVIGSCPGGLWANIASDGAFQSGAGVTGNISLATGNYEVDFTQDVSGCAYIVNLQNSAAGTATSATRGINNFGVYIATFDTTGNLANESFSLTVYC